MRKNIQRVLRAFFEGRAASDRTCSTDGVELKSYAVVIAFRHDWPNAHVITALQPDMAWSQTTKGQIRAMNLALDTWTCEAHEDCKANKELGRACFLSRNSRAVTDGPYVFSHQTRNV